MNERPVCDGVGFLMYAFRTFGRAGEKTRLKNAEESFPECAPRRRRWGSLGKRSTVHARLYICRRTHTHTMSSYSFGHGGSSGVRRSLRARQTNRTQPYATSRHGSGFIRSAPFSISATFCASIYSHPECAPRLCVRMCVCVYTYKCVCVCVLAGIYVGAPSIRIPHSQYENLPRNATTSPPPPIRPSRSLRSFRSLTQMRASIFLPPPPPSASRRSSGAKYTHTLTQT